MYVAKTKALISFAVTAKLICVFVFAYAKRLFSHDAAHICLLRIPVQYNPFYYLTTRLLREIIASKYVWLQGELTIVSTHCKGFLRLIKSDVI